MKTLIAAILATMMGASAMAGEAQVFKPNGETETFTGVEGIHVTPEGKAVSLKDENGDIIAVVIDMPVIVRNDVED